MPVMTPSLGLFPFQRPALPHIHLCPLPFVGFPWTLSLLQFRVQENRGRLRIAPPRDEESSSQRRTIRIPGYFEIF